MAKLTFLQLAQKVLSESPTPRSPEEIWQFALARGYTEALESTGKTPSISLGSRLYTSVKDPQSLFSAIDERPKRFYLKEPTVVQVAPSSPLAAIAPIAPPPFLEKDLHPLLVYYAKHYLNAYCKTLNHSHSNRTKFAEWLHPDIVGCHFQTEDWCSETSALSRAVGATHISLYAFELKRKLSFSNLREAFFQAVSNASWANEGYLCAADIYPDPEFTTELKRLSSAFGIGILKLDTANPDDSEILFPAKRKETLDWESINKLCINKDFSTFLTRIRLDLSSQEIRKEQYDPVPTAEALHACFAASASSH